MAIIRRSNDCVGFVGSFNCSFCSVLLFPKATYFDSSLVLCNCFFYFFLAVVNYFWFNFVRSETTFCGVLSGLQACLKRNIYAIVLCCGVCCFESVFFFTLSRQQLQRRRQTDCAAVEILWFWPPHVSFEICFFETIAFRVSFPTWPQVTFSW